MFVTEERDLGYSARHFALFLQNFYGVLDPFQSQDKDPLPMFRISSTYGVSDQHAEDEEQDDLLKGRGRYRDRVQQQAPMDQTSFLVRKLLKDYRRNSDRTRKFLSKTAPIHAPSRSEMELTLIYRHVHPAQRRHLAAIQAERTEKAKSWMVHFKSERGWDGKVSLVD
ncbi:hypothetical protein BG011_002216 [Mortierella polycephala]|uniref:Uncharacterized protein n=1 Tax=Mortierella polycephala TaxID=41804 RepID=A0A9P6Q813_9FUNG|nr:hypothetical protein BG011_002216 [Mortierella polycephala]